MPDIGDHSPGTEYKPGVPRVAARRKTLRKRNRTAKKPASPWETGFAWKTARRDAAGMPLSIEFGQGLTQEVQTVPENILAGAVPQAGATG